MVKGTIKLVDPAKNLLIVSQKLKGESVDRELSITEKVEIVIKDGKEELVGTGVEALRGSSKARKVLLFKLNAIRTSTFSR